MSPPFPPTSYESVREWLQDTGFHCSGSSNNMELSMAWIKAARKRFGIPTNARDPVRPLRSGRSTSCTIPNRGACAFPAPRVFAGLPSQTLHAVQRNDVVAQTRPVFAHKVGDLLVENVVAANDTLSA